MKEVTIFGLRTKLLVEEGQHVYDFSDALEEYEGGLRVNLGKFIEKSRESQQHCYQCDALAPQTLKGPDVVSGPCVAEGRELESQPQRDRSG